MVASQASSMAQEWKTRALALDHELTATRGSLQQLAESTADVLRVRSSLPPLPVFTDSYPGDPSEIRSHPVTAM